MELIDGLKHVFKEHVENRSRIWELGKAHMRKQTIRTSLGLGWVFIRDIIYFSVFMVFRYLIAGGQKIDGVNFLLYILTGLIPWFFMNEIINAGTKAIINNAAILHSMRFPITILPTIEVLAIFMKRMFTIGVLFIVTFLLGDINKVNIMMFIYFFMSMYILMLGYNLLMSALLSLSHDLRELYNSLTSILMYFLPIIWTFSAVGNSKIKFLLKLNPMVYVVEGIRGSLVGNKLPTFEYTIYFWFVILSLIVVGSFTQYKLRRYYQDFI